MEMACNTENLAGELLRHEFRNTTRAEDAGGRRGSDLPPLPIFLWPLPEGGQGGGDPSPPTADSSRAEEGPLRRAGQQTASYRFFQKRGKVGRFPGLGAYYDRPLCVHCPLSKTWGEKL